MLARMQRMGNPDHSGWECKLVQPLWKTVWSFLKKLNIELPYDPGIPLLAIYPKKTKTLIQRNICTPIFITALFTIAKPQKQPKCPLVDKRIKKMWYICSMEYYLAIKKKEWNLAICNNMDGPWGYYVKWNKSEKDKYHTISFICWI